ncbi:hypothetical protein [Allocoleopsis sp.]|uniref:hypothetical protein n=1 Tax=Allocoleopsis sp. TaxID=3088169 RepID=UPI002FD2D368
MIVTTPNSSFWQNDKPTIVPTPAPPLKNTVLKYQPFIQALGESIGQLEEDEQQLIVCLQNLIKNLEFSAEEACRLAIPELQKALQNLQQSPTEYTKIFLSKVNLDFDGLLAAVKLVQIYFQTTQPLNQTLTDLKNTLTRLSECDIKDIGPLNTDNKPSQVLELVEPVEQDRCNLHHKLCEGEGALKQGKGPIEEIDQIQSLRMGSEEILRILDNQVPQRKLSVFQRMAQFIAHLKEVKETLNFLSRQGTCLSDTEIEDIKKLIQNWGKAIEKIQNLENIEDLTDVSKSRQAIAQSIQIHDFLEENYNYLAEIFRSNALLSAVIL